MADERARWDHDADDGFTLVEVLLTVFLMSTAFIVVLGALLTTITAADTHRRLSTAQAVVRDVAEYVKSGPYVECTGSWPTYDISGFSVPNGYAASIVGVPAIWNGDADATFTPVNIDDAAPEACPPQDLGVQRITVQVTGTTVNGKTVTERLTLLKRRQS